MKLKTIKTIMICAVTSVTSAAYHSMEWYCTDASFTSSNSNNAIVYKNVVSGNYEVLIESNKVINEGMDISQSQGFKKNRKTDWFTAASNDAKKFVEISGKSYLAVNGLMSDQKHYQGQLGLNNGDGATLELKDMRCTKLNHSFGRVPAKRRK